MKRFPSHSEENIIAKIQNLFPTNTVKANKAVVNLFRSSLKEKHMETNFEMFDIAKLAENSPILSLQSYNINKHNINFVEEPMKIWHL